MTGEWSFRDEDWWNGDVYLTGLIGAMALQHRDHGNSHPDGIPAEEWKVILTKIGEPLVAYAAGKFADAPGSLMEDAQAALHLFADYFVYFWD